ncbi:TauD/TfdA family dioxygenase [Actinomadura sp. B10D3]|uniref:TauD/TfdA family dioxygenase n=1 Tax=Actinomadura sp. B10D3 TaxID=3153557 RepID=UPI00325E4136
MAGNKSRQHEMETMRGCLDSQGYSLLTEVGGLPHVHRILSLLGEMLPHADGRLLYEVKARHGFESLRFTKSTNGIPVHTEAPGTDPPPRLVALYCHTMARCGGGHTDLVDGREFIATLGTSDRDLIQSHLVDFPPPGADDERLPIRRGVVSFEDGIGEVIRFSSNLFSFGAYEAEVNGTPDSRATALGEFGPVLSRLAAEFFAQHRIRTLIPEDALLVWNNHRMLHARAEYKDARRHLTRFWLS